MHPHTARACMQPHTTRACVQTHTIRAYAYLCISSHTPICMQMNACRCCCMHWIASRKGDLYISPLLCMHYQTVSVVVSCISLFVLCLLRCCAVCFCCLTFSGVFAAAAVMYLLCLSLGVSVCISARISYLSPTGFVNLFFFLLACAASVSCLLILLLYSCLC